MLCSLQTVLRWLPVLPPFPDEDIRDRKGKPWPPSQGGVWARTRTPRCDFETPSLIPEALVILPQFCRLLSCSKPWCPWAHRQHQVHREDSISPVGALPLGAVGYKAVDKVPVHHHALGHPSSCKGPLGSARSWGRISSPLYAYRHLRACCLRASALIGPVSSCFP